MPATVSLVRRFTKEQLLGFRGATLPDLIGPDLRLLFVGINPGLWTAAVQGRDYAEQHGDLHPRLDAAGPAFLSEVRSVVDQGRLDETFVDATCDPPEVFTYGGMIAHVLTFGAFRRTRALELLDEAGVTDLGWGDPMRYVAT